MRYFIQQLWFFGIKQAYACVFGGALLFLILLTKLCWQSDFAIARYDALFVLAIAMQVVFVKCKLESWEEVRVILVFHVVGTLMEIFKTSVGSWVYPEENLLRISGVPLFSGFMYSAVGSYMARVWRIFEFRFTHFPSRQHMIALSVLIYINFFTHHYMLDMRYVLFAYAAILYGRTQVYFKPHERHFHMPLLLGFFLVAFFIWLAENISTFGAIWVYPNQHHAWHLVHFAKMGSWFLLMNISFVLVSLLHKEATQSIN